jgi:hypothetical protein
MIRLHRTSVVFLTMAGLALAQVPPAGNAPGRGPAGGRGGLASVVIGPPAPVPPQVAIQRPTAEELTQVNAEMRMWIDSNKTPSQAC